MVASGGETATCLSDVGGLGRCAVLSSRDLCIRETDGRCLSSFSTVQAAIVLKTLIKLVVSVMERPAAPNNAKKAPMNSF